MYITIEDSEALMGGIVEGHLLLCCSPHHQELLHFSDEINVH
jgi:hypothetical protein